MTNTNDTSNDKTTKNLDQEKKENILLVILGIIALVIVAFIIFRLTYAYFTSTVKDLDPDKEDAVVSTASLEVQYVDGESGFEIGTKIGPGTEITKSFSVVNNGTGVGHFQIILEAIQNTFSRTQDLTYTLKRKDGTTVGIGTITSDPTNFPTADDATKNGGKVVIASDEVVTGTNEYVLTVKYEETNTDQSEDMGKVLAAKINIKEVDSEQRNAASESTTTSTTSTTTTTNTTTTTTQSGE